MRKKALEMGMYIPREDEEKVTLWEFSLISLLSKGKEGCGRSGHAV